MFNEKGWQIPVTWDELISLCEQIKAEGEVAPFYLGYLDTWTILSPWNSITVNMVPPDLARQVNAGKATFAEYYGAPARRMRQLLQYSQTCLPGEPGPFAASYNDACTSFANGKSAMYPCGSFAVPQILTGNPDINVGMFAMPSADNPDDRIVVSGVDLQWCVAETCKHKDAVYEVLSYLSEPDNMQTYISDQRAIPCIEGDFELDPLFDGIKDFWMKAECSTIWTIPIRVLWQSMLSFRQCFRTTKDLKTKLSIASYRSLIRIGRVITAKLFVKYKSTRVSSKGGVLWQILVRARWAQDA